MPDQYSFKKPTTINIGQDQFSKRVQFRNSPPKRMKAVKRNSSLNNLRKGLANAGKNLIGNIRDQTPNKRNYGGFNVNGNYIRKDPPYEKNNPHQRLL